MYVHTVTIRRRALILLYMPTFKAEHIDVNIPNSKTKDIHKSTILAYDFPLEFQWVSKETHFDYRRIKAIDSVRIRSRNAQPYPRLIY